MSDPRSRPDLIPDAFPDTAPFRPAPDYMPDYRRGDFGFPEPLTPSISPSEPWPEPEGGPFENDPLSRPDG